MSNETIQSTIEAAASYLNPLTTANQSALQTESGVATISFSNLSVCEKVKGVSGKSLTSTSQYGSALSGDIANFNQIATTFAEKDAQISKGV